MAYANINPLFLSWQQQGLDFLLAENPVEDAYSLCKEHRLSPAPQKNVSVVKPQDKPLNQGNSSVNQWHQLKSTQKEQKITSTEIKTTTTHDVVFSEQNLPKPWQLRLKNTVATPVLFSYWELGYDLYGQVDMNRRKLLINIITQDLKQPANAYSFWPIGLPDSTQIVANSEAFWLGIKLLKPRGLVFFGTHSAKSAGLSTKSVEGNIFWHENCKILVCPSLNYALDNTSLHQQMLRYLKSFLLGFMPSNHPLRNNQPLQ